MLTMEVLALFQIVFAPLKTISISHLLTFGKYLEYVICRLMLVLMLWLNMRIVFIIKITSLGSQGILVNSAGVFLRCYGYRDEGGNLMQITKKIKNLTPKE